MFPRMRTMVEVEDGDCEANLLMNPKERNGKEVSLRLAVDEVEV